MSFMGYWAIQAEPSFSAETEPKRVEPRLGYNTRLFRPLVYDIREYSGGGIEGDVTGPGGALGGSEIQVQTLIGPSTRL